MGYTPVFDTVFTGTLCGKWPDIGVWVCLLAMADRHGVIDKTPQYISAVMGISVEELMGCIERFMQPDEHSRSSTADGRRLVLLDESRPWGWRIVNHSLYREKARKQAYDSERIASGRDAERKREQRAMSRDVPTRPDASRSQTQTQTKTQTEEKKDISRLDGARVPSRHIDLVFQHWQQVHGHPEARCNEKRRRLIATRLKEYSLEELRECITGYSLSPFHCGENERNQRYDSIELMLRDNQHVEQGIAFARHPPKNGTRGTSDKGRRLTRYEQYFGTDDDDEEQHQSAG